MSLEGFSPLITDWMKLGLKWRYRWFPKTGPFTVPARGNVQLPNQDFTFAAPEGVLLFFGALFDHKECGIRLEFSPNLDTDDFFVIGRFSALGIVNQPWFVVATVPPASLPGFYGITQCKEWGWTDWMRLHVINNDIIPHTCLGYSYIIATLDEPRPDERLTPLKEMARVQQMLELYPELRESLRRKYADEAEQFIKDMKLKVKLEAG